MITEAEIRQMIRNIFSKITGYVPLKDGIYEFEDKENISKYSNIVWEIMESSYRNLGGFKTYRNKNDLVQFTSLLILCVLNHKVVAAAIYRDDLGGQKLNGCGTIDGKQEHKEMLKQVIRSDIENLNKWHWVEVSHPLEKWFKEMGGNPIPSQMVPNLLHKSKSKIEFMPDNVHYKRQIANDVDNTYVKAIYGFKDPHTYKKVMAKLEQYTGFQEYNDFKNHINSLPKITEEIDYLNNYPDRKVATAMEVIIQFGNLYGDGIYDVSPRMYTWLKNAVQLLGQSKTQDKKIKSFYEKGCAYLKIFKPIIMYTFDDADYILGPLK